MALFSKQSCEHCGNTAGMMTRTKLADGKYICYDCGLKCPGFVTNNFLGKWTYQDFLEYLQFREINKKRLESFNINDVYFNKIFVDKEKGWLVFSHSGNEFYDKATMLQQNPDIFDMRGLVYYKFFYDIKDVKEGVMKEKVTFDTRLILAFKNRWYPYSFNDTVLKNHKVKGSSTGVIGSMVDVSLGDYETGIQAYLSKAMENNGINEPVAIGNKLTMNFDFSPYDEYLKKLFELNKLGVFKDEEFEKALKDITPSATLRHKLKSTYGK